MKSFFIASVIVVLAISVYSCYHNSSESDIDIELRDADLGGTSEFTQKIQNVKDALADKLPKICEFSEKSLSISRSVNRELEVAAISDSETKEILVSLATPIVEMLKAQGFSEKDWAEFEDTSDPAFILTGILYLGMQEANAEHDVVPLMQIWGENEDDDTCWDMQRIVACAAAAIGIDVIYNAFNGIKCITKAVALSTLNIVAKSVLGTAQVIVFIVEFSVCMGWI